MLRLASSGSADAASEAARAQREIAMLREKVKELEAAMEQLRKELKDELERELQAAFRRGAISGAPGQGPGEDFDIDSHPEMLAARREIKELKERVAELEQELLDSQAEATEYRRKTMALQKQLEEYQDPGFESALRRGGVIQGKGNEAELLALQESLKEEQKNRAAAEKEAKRLREEVARLEELLASGSGGGGQEVVLRRKVAEMEKENARLLQVIHEKDNEIKKLRMTLLEEQLRASGLANVEEILEELGLRVGREGGFAGSRMKVFDRLYQDAKDRIGRLRDLRMKVRRLEETEFGKRMKDLLGEVVQALPGASVWKFE